METEMMAGRQRTNKSRRRRKGESAEPSTCWYLAVRVRLWSVDGRFHFLYVPSTVRPIRAL